MPVFKAGFAKTTLRPRIGSMMLGFDAWACTAQHDDLHARALLLEQGDTRACVLSLDLCFLSAAAVAEICAEVARRTGIPAGNILVCTTHTHAAPDVARPDSFLAPLAQSCAEAVEAAQRRLQPAALACGYGQLHGHSINRRWIHRPIDPAVTVLRVDDLSGRPLGAIANFGCHAVVLGMKNRQLSADYPGHAMAAMERALGNDCVCLFTQGGAGDVNPLDARVRAELTGGQSVRGNGGPSAVYYGPADENSPHMGINWGDGDAAGFARVAELGDALAAECLRVHRGLSPRAPQGRLWSRNHSVRAGLAPGEEYVPGVPVTAEWKAQRQERFGLAPDENRALHLHALGVDGPDALTLMAIPGELFSMSAVELRRQAEALGRRCPFVVTYANGFDLYLPPAEVYAEGGYEAQNGEELLHSPNVVTRIEEGFAQMLRESASAGV